MHLPDPGRRWVVAANWRMDHRVHLEREEGDLDACGHFVSVADADDWWEARQLYFQEEVCCPGAPSASGRASAYSKPTNGRNRISARIAGFDELVHVGSLNALLRRAARSERAADVELVLRKSTGIGLPARSLTSSRSDLQVAELARRLNSQGAEAVREVAGTLADSLGDNEPPWWATFSEEIRGSLESDNASEICAALGLGHRLPGEWLVVWRYPVAEAAPLYRPTVLEANDSPYHFPSPPAYPIGITMPLGSVFSAVREVLHPPLRGVTAVERCTGKVLFLESLPVVRDNGTLAALRNEHRERLRNEFPMDGLSAWMDRHPELTP